ncbi:MAG: molybdopterin-dependent oxidoreductase [Acidobacteriaceae bacterium]|nr:molybdopterin-dependent oxidoreductase [Acidobacteriaceae bacterium]
MSNAARHPEIVLPEPDLERELRRRSRRDFLVAGLAAIGGIGAYEWIRSAADQDNAPWPQRGVLDFNGKLSHGYLSDSHLMPTFPPERIGYLKTNGDIGLTSSFDANNWQLQVKYDQNAPAFALHLSDITSLPRVEMITRFCCIEGWSVVTSWAGARFSDFTRRFFPAGQKLPPYVYMATPDENYYVGLDLKSAMHPQTLLAYEHNGRPLQPEHGAPLRLVIPVKYGIKNIKRIGLIQYARERPGDYWAEEGYDWFAGL